MQSNEGFSPAERARARAYHGPNYVAFLADVVLAAGLLAALAWTSLGHWLFSPLDSLPAVADGCIRLARMRSTIEAWMSPDVRAGSWGALRDDGAIPSRRYLTSEIS